MPLKRNRRVSSVRGYHLNAATKMISEVIKPEDAVPHNKISYKDAKHSCLKAGILYEDPDFPASDESLYVKQKTSRNYVWKRPKEIVSKPSLFVGGASRFDIVQGKLGNCWLMAAVAALCQHTGLLYQVIPSDQHFERGYCGIFRFRIWQYGQWEEVIIDDRLPTYNNKLVYLHSSEHNEFWSALLEKAYAKVCGSYEALNGGSSSEAMEDFTGGIAETFDFKDLPSDFFKLLLKAEERQSLMCCALNDPSGRVEYMLDNGLITGHAYTITGVKKVHVKKMSKNVELVRIRNPWGNEREWNGAWSDKSKEWDMLNDNEKNIVGVSYDDDGEFWMCFEDFVANFTKAEICMLMPDSAGMTKGKHWKMKVKQGTWQKYVSAGGCTNYRDTTFHLNPQYRITLDDTDDDCVKCSIVLGLLQKGRRKLKQDGPRYLSIGFVIYEMLEDSDQYLENDRLGKDFFMYSKSVAQCKNFINTREVLGRFSLPPGEYVIIPSTYRNDLEGDFILRIFSEKAHETDVMDTCTEDNSKEMKVEDNTKFDQKLHTVFNHVAGEDGEVDSFELRTVVSHVFRNEIEGQSFSLEACRSMLAMVDIDRSGKLNYEEFRNLWQKVIEWKSVFQIYDRDDSGDMSAHEIRGALSKLGYKLSTPALSSITLRYANTKGGVSVDDFIQICCRVKSTFESYKTYHVPDSFPIDDFIMSTIYT